MNSFILTGSSTTATPSGITMIAGSLFSPRKTAWLACPPRFVSSGIQSFQLTTSCFWQKRTLPLQHWIP